MDYLAVLKKRWWIVVGVAIVLTVAAIGISLAMEPQYRASTRLLYQKSNLDVLVTGEAIFSSTNADREVQGGALLVDAVADSVIDDLGLETSREALLDRTEVKAFTSTDVIEVTVVSDDPQEAADTANAFAKELIAFRDGVEQDKVGSAIDVLEGQIESLSPSDAASDYGAQLRARLSGLHILQTRPVSGFRVISAATPPPAPFSPRLVLNAVRAFILGILVGIGLAFLVHILVMRAGRRATRQQ